MMTNQQNNQPVTQENQITPFQEFRGLMENPQTIERFKLALGERRGEQFMVSVLNVVSQDEKLRKSDPVSIIVSCLQAASLDLPIERDLGYAWVLPYYSKKAFNGRGGYAAQFQIGYKGFVQLAIRTGQYLTLHAGRIFEGQEIHSDQLTGKLTLSGSPKSETVIGFVAYCKMTNGFEAYEYMTYEQMYAHAKRYAPSWGKGDNPDPQSPWATHFNAMGEGKILKKLLKTYGLTTAGKTPEEQEKIRALQDAIEADEGEQDQDLGIALAEANGGKTLSDEVQQDLVERSNDGVDVVDGQFVETGEQPIPADEIDELKQKLEKLTAERDAARQDKIDGQEKSDDPAERIRAQAARMKEQQQQAEAVRNHQGAENNPKQKPLDF